MAPRDSHPPQKQPRTRPLLLILIAAAVIGMIVLFGRPFGGSSSNMKDSVSSPKTKPGGAGSVIMGDGWSFTTSVPGDGIHFPKKGSRVSIHYVGTLENGELFDSSRQRGSPFQTTIGVGRVIRGWDEAVPRMSLGQRVVLTIQPEAGYGSRDTGKIPKNSVLIFNVELLEILS